MFKNREQAGILLALKLKKIVKKENFIIAPLLHGGIILGKIISNCFNFPLKPLIVKKIGAPLNPELGIGAVTFDETYYFNEDMLKDLNISIDYKKTVLKNKYKEAKSLQNKIEKNMEKTSWIGENVLVIDDGIATGNSAICAAIYLNKQKVKKIILAIPVISKDMINNIEKYFDRIVSLKIVDDLSSVSQFYEEFPQVTDEEILNYLL